MFSGLLHVSRFASCFPACSAFADLLSAFRFGFAPAFLVLRSFCPIYSVLCLSFECFAVILLKIQEKRAIRITFGVFAVAFFAFAKVSLKLLDLRYINFMSLVDLLTFINS